MNILNDQLVVDELRNKIQNNVHDNIDVDETNVEVIWNNFKEAALQAAEEVLGEKTPYRGSKKRTPWWGEEVKTAVRSKIKHFRIWMKSRSVEDRQAYVQTRNEVQRVKRKSKEESWRKIGEDLKADFKGTKKLLYNLANNYRGKRQCISYAIKDKNDCLLTELGEIAVRWREYFSELLNEPNNHVADENQDDVVRDEEESNGSPITINEITKAMAKMRKGRSPGEDGLPVEVLKGGGTTVLEQLLNICNRAYETEMVPSDWQKGIISPIFKKGKKTICDNHRGITLFSHAGKIYTRIVETRLRECIEGVLDLSQYGFRPGRSTTDVVFIVKMLLEKSWEWGIDQYAFFVDLEKAFDRVNRNHLWEVLQENRYDIPTKLIRVIRSIYSQCASKVKTSKIESEAFSIESCVRQGDVI